MFKDIIAAFGEYYYITIILVILLIVTAFVWIKAIGASRKKGRQRDDILAKLNAEKELRKEFEDLTAEKAQSAEPERLLKGIALNIQRELEKNDDMDAAFAELPEEKRFVYALDFVFCEDAEKLSDFFRKNGKQLIIEADEAVRHIIGGGFCALFHRGFCMFDDDNEEFSVLPDTVKALDEEYSAALESGKANILGAVKKCICENINIYNKKEM